MRASIPPESKRCNTDGRSVWTRGETMLKNNHILVKFDHWIIVSLWTLEINIHLLDLCVGSQLHWTEFDYYCITHTKQIKTHHRSVKLQQGKPIYKNTCYDVSTSWIRPVHVVLQTYEMHIEVQVLCLWHNTDEWNIPYPFPIYSPHNHGTYNFPGSSILIIVKNQSRDKHY